MATVDHSIDYSRASPASNAGSSGKEKLERCAKSKPYLQKPEHEKRRAKKIEMSEAYHTAIGVKARIRLLVIDRDVS